MAISVATLTLNVHNKPHTTTFPISKPLFSRFSRLQFHLHASSSSSPSSSSNPDNILWLREEQRWLREEQRWLREESRWINERESLLRQIAELNLKIQALDRHNSLQVLSDVVESGPSIGRIIAKSGSSASPLMLEAKEEEGVKKKVVKEEVVVVKSDQIDVKIIQRKTLRKGSEGEEVRVLQEALQRLGFYSGEEDVEFSSFSTGTERAVKTWQASLDISEDGIMTADLLERLYTDEPLPTKDGTNGAVVYSVTSISETKQTDVKEKYDASQNRVFLLGENRWEEPSRLIGGNDSKVGRSIISKASTMCLVCRGDGRVLCMECDGTGEPNIEPQFMEWVGEGTKCAYCEGLGFIVCDLCEGKTIA